MVILSCQNVDSFAAQKSNLSCRTRSSSPRCMKSSDKVVTSSTGHNIPHILPSITWDYAEFNTKNMNLAHQLQLNFKFNSGKKKVLAACIK